jgi:hypothetical protein
LVYLNEKPYRFKPYKIGYFEYIKESLYIDKEYKIYYDDCKNNILKLYTYEDGYLIKYPIFIFLWIVYVPHI